MVGTAGGKVMILSSDNLAILDQLENEQVANAHYYYSNSSFFLITYFPLKTAASVDAIATETDCRCLYVAHENGLIKAWNGRLSIYH